ncbi:MAG: hypothetical protein DRO13_04615 [Thermoprotei archaeon]|nr:MAG: hypothetical protein DRO13_04615 [Thermoprotei archaeon]
MLFAVFLIANVIVLPLGYIAIKSLVRIFLRTPKKLLTPMILAFCRLLCCQAQHTRCLTNANTRHCWLPHEEKWVPVALLVLGLTLRPLVEIYIS